MAPALPDADGCVWARGGVSQAAAARALARYVDDLEGELEAADDAVVRLRRELTEGEANLSEVSASNTKLAAEAEELNGALEKAKAVLMTTEAELDAKEKAAELAAEQLMDSQKSAEASAQATQGEAQARAVRLESQLMAAEAKAAEQLAERERLESSMADIGSKRQLAEEAAEYGAARVRELEQAAAEAEAKAEAKAAALTESETSVGRLMIELRELKSAQERVAASNGAATNGVANGVNGAPKNGAAAKTNGASSATFDVEAKRLTDEIEKQLAGTGMQTGGMPTGGGGGGSATLVALSRMKKSDLMAECETRKIEVKGSVAELRATLRVERKRDGLVTQLCERGWSERQARTALGKAAWDVDAAIDSLLKR